MLLTGARTAGGSLIDVRLDGPVVAQVAAVGTLEAPAGTPVVELGGYLLLPAPAEPHAHLDKALTAARIGNDTGDLAGAIAAWVGQLDLLTHSDIAERAERAALALLANGATAVRTHVNIGGGQGLLALYALAEVRERLRPVMDIQLVGMVAVPLTGLAGADNRSVLRDAVDAGADLLGGAPHIDDDPVAAAQFCLDLAVDAGMGVDLHIDETLDPDLCHLDILAEQARGAGVPVTASHCVSLAMQPPARQVACAQALAEAGVAVVTLPQTNLFLQARGVAVAPPRGLTALRPLLDAGVRVAGGGDNLQDPFNPVGRADPLETASLLVAAGHLTVDEAYAAVSAGARAVLGLPGAGLADAGLPDAGLQPGASAELLAVRAGSMPEAVGGASADRMVWHAGRLVARTCLDRRVGLDAGI